MRGAFSPVDGMCHRRIEPRAEKELIQAFVDRIDQLKPRLVTFNGSSFDLPVLRYRAMVNRVSAPGLAKRNYFNRYTDDAIDLCLTQEPEIFHLVELATLDHAPTPLAHGHALSMPASDAPHGRASRRRAGGRSAPSSVRCGRGR